MKTSIAATTQGTRRAAAARRTRNAPSAALRGALAEAERRLAAAPDPLAGFTREHFEANRAAGVGDTLGAGPRLAPRR